MSGYSPLFISKPEVGLIQSRQNFILPNDAYPVLQNMYVWREQIKRKKGCQLLGRLQRQIGTTDGSGDATITISPNPLNPGISTFTVGSEVFTDIQLNASPADVGLITNGPGTGDLDRSTGVLTITGSIPNTAVNYFPGLPVMGCRIREQQNSTNDLTVFFDQCYAYVFNSSTNEFQEWIPGTTWNSHGATPSGTDFFWSTNYWTSGTAFSPFMTINNKLFWVTNNTGQFGATADPPRITDGSTWVDFYDDTLPATNSPWAQIDSATPNPNFLTNFLAMLPFRGRMVTFNTWEGPNATSSLNYSNRIRWSTIGNPFIPYTAGPPAAGSWRDDIRGQGGFLDIPTSEDIVSVGFVRDNLVIYCERSTWQLRYTGRSIAPFQIEKVNSELGAEGTFCTVQFDTSLVGIGDKGIVECDSYKSERIDIKIPDFVFQFNNLNNGPSRVAGIRDFVNRLAFWTVPIAGKYSPEFAEGDQLFPNQRLVYNYENDSWALFDDSYTCFGTYQVQSSRTWLNTPLPWIKCNFNWIDNPIGDPVIVAGNQQGFVEQLTQLTVNDISLFIQNIEGEGNDPTVITCPNHNLLQNAVIQITGILSTDPFYSLNSGQNDNDGIFQVDILDANRFSLWVYNPEDDQFSIPQSDDPFDFYQGQGYITVRDNFTVTSKKFNFAEEGQSIQMGYIDVLMQASESNQPGAISLNVFLNYNDQQASNTLPQNAINDGSSPSVPDTFFNSVIPTTQSTLSNIGGTKFWQRVFCPTRANFLTLQYTFNNYQMAHEEQTKDVQIDAQVLWVRRAGRMTII